MFGGPIEPRDCHGTSCLTMTIYGERAHAISNFPISQFCHSESALGGRENPFPLYFHYYIISYFRLYQTLIGKRLALKSYSSKPVQWMIRSPIGKPGFVCLNARNKKITVMWVKLNQIKRSKRSFEALQIGQTPGGLSRAHK